MQYRNLGETQISVSVLCLGTMTWGQQNDRQDAHAQLDFARTRGVNFIDTAEIYPFPIDREKLGATEEILGTWLSGKQKSSKRASVVIATKVAGPCPLPLRRHLRQSRLRLDRANIRAACEESLHRLGCDVIDLYQMHWPERRANRFGRLGFPPNSLASDADVVPLEESLAGMKELLEEGKILSFGVSNETPWGVMQACRIAEQLGIRDKLVSIQNPYSLVNRSFEIGLAEVALQENVGLLAYAPLGGGILSGKYLDGARPEGSRLVLFPEHTTRYFKPNSEPAVRAYCDLAQSRGLSSTHLALSFVTDRPFVTSNIIGATSLAQLKHNIDSAEVQLDSETLSAIERIGERYTDPCP